MFASLKWSQVKLWRDDIVIGSETCHSGKRALQHGCVLLYANSKHKFLKRSFLLKLCVLNVLDKSLGTNLSHIEWTHVEEFLFSPSAGVP